MEHWVTARLPDELTRPPLEEQVATLRQIIAQDLEPDPDGSGRMRIRHGVAEDRRVSIEDKEMRHGRKTKSKRFNGYKRHLAIDLDTVLVLAVAVLPANRPEQEAASEPQNRISPDELVAMIDESETRTVGSVKVLFVECGTYNQCSKRRHVVGRDRFRKIIDARVVGLPKYTHHSPVELPHRRAV